VTDPEQAERADLDRLRAQVAELEQVARRAADQLEAHGRPNTADAIRHNLGRILGCR
jgi:hypothetical protein